jgi:cell division protein FtsI/penicillin-binding protein 2
MDDTRSYQVTEDQLNLVQTCADHLGERQAAAEEVLDNALDETERWCASAMDPTTVKRYIAITPLNPNAYWNYASVFTDNTPYNRAVSQDYEPGSVFKVLTMAAALDSGTVTPDTEFVDTGSIQIGGLTIHNWDWGAWGPQTMQGCLAHSLNVCLTWIVLRMHFTSMHLTACSA